MKPRTSFAAVGAAGVLALSGVGVAAAGQNMMLSSDTSAPASSSSAARAAAPSGDDITLPAGSALAERVTAFCRRSDQVIDRIEKRQAAVAKNGGKVTERVQKRIARLKDHNYPKRVEHLQNRLDRRTRRAQNLPDRLAEVKKAADECGDLGLR